MTTIADLRAALQITNVRAFYAAVREKESNQTDDAYTLVNFAAPDDPARGVKDHHFSSFADHPYAGLSTREGGYAAGAAQFIPSTWAEVARQYGLPDFSPPNQDAGYVARLVYRGALEDVIAGRFEDAVAKCRLEWTSLPGAAESHSGWTLEKARAVFEAHGGGVSLTRQERPELPPGTPISSTPRGGTVNPLLSLLTPIAGALFQAFSGNVQARIAKEVDRHSDTPGSGQVVADALSDALVKFAQQATGRSDPLEAVAVARQDKAIVAQAETVAEQTVAQKIAELAPLLAQTVEWDKAKWEAEREGRKTSSAIAIAERKAGLWDMTRSLVYFAGWTSTILVLALGAAIIYQAIVKDDINGGLLGVAGPLLAIALGVWREVFAYRFDGTKDSAAQTQAIVDMTKQGR